MKEQTKKPEELKDFPFPLSVERAEVRDIDLEHKLPLDLFLRHDGHELMVGDKKYTLSIPNYPSHPRDALELEITTWRGRSLNAIHFYGHLLLPHLHFIEDGTHASVYGGDLPIILRKIELHRLITADEIREYKDRYHGYEVGDMVEGFNTTQQLVRRARGVARRYFPGFRVIFSEE